MPYCYLSIGHLNQGDLHTMCIGGCASTLLSMSEINGYPICLLYVWVICSIPMHKPQEKLTSEKLTSE